MSAHVRIAITAGEPAGIGPDLCCALSPRHNTELVIIADYNLLQSRANELGIEFNAKPFDPALAAARKPEHIPEQISVLSLPTAAPVSTGALNSINSAYVLESITTAVDGCHSGLFDAMVTAPVHKGVINDAGIPFSGHTEFIAERVNATPLMVLAAEQLRVALVTTHLPLKDVSRAITQQGVIDCLHILHNDLQSKYQIARPHILVCGLNPHAGESGHLGMEEIETITPAIEAAKQQGINATGPLPADTLFTDRHLQNADAVLAMYHDQGLPVLKYAGFGKSVNITFGLPIIRTSVDHGTALDLAGSGKAESGSLHAAIDLAIDLARNQANH